MSATVTPTPYEEHRDHVLMVLRRRCGWLDAADREALLHEAYAVVLEKERDGTLDVAAMRPQQLRAYLVQTALHKALDEGKRAGRRRAVALDDELEVASTEPEAGDLVARGAEAARLREIVAELPARQQQIIKLRFFLDRTPGEVRRCLGVTDRAYRRDLERAMRTLAERFELVREGTFCESRRSLILAYVAGVSGPNRARQARRHLETCTACAHWAAELRTTAEKAGALVPTPLVLDEGRGLRGLARGLEALRERVTDLLGGVASRIDPAAGSMVAGMRPGAAAALVVGCLSVGSTATYCAIEGFPSFPTVGGEERPQARSRPAERPARASERVPERRPAGPGAVTAASTPARQERPKQRTAARSTSKPRTTKRERERKKAKETELATAPEFGVEGTGTASGGTAAAPAAPVKQAPPSSGGWGTEFGP